MNAPSIEQGIRGRQVVSCLLLFVAALSLLAARVHAAAAPLQEYSVKAALLFNFAKYTEWPAKAFPQPDSPIVIGVLGDDPFGEVLDRVVNDRSIKGRSIVIRRASGTAPLAGAHLVFVSASQPQAPQDCAALERAGALTVGDTEITAGYTAVNFAVEGDRIVFNVDLERSLRAGANISSQLLRFAKNVKRPEATTAR